MLKSMKRIYALQIFLILILAFTAGSAQTPQKNIHNREQLWFGYFNQTRITDRFGIWLDVHYRMTDNFVDRPFQFVFRPALIYFIKDNLRLNAGYTLTEHFPGKGLNTTRTEHRGWQQIWWNQKYPGLTTLQSLRFEQRFNENVVDDIVHNGYNFNLRLRYSFSFLIPLTGKEIVPYTPFLALANEILLNFGDRIIYNTFDQNRLSAGLGYQLTSRLMAQLGYMNIYQQESSGNNYFLTHAIRLLVFHSLDFRDKH